MRLIAPDSLQDALAAKAEHPEAVPLAGGTDLMVELNFDRRRPRFILDLTRIAELREREVGNGHVRIGATVSYTSVIRDLGARLPGLAIAARTVGSPQIRNRGTVGGNLGAASPAGDCHPPLLAAGAEIEVRSVRGERRIAARDFYTGPKRNALLADELITAIHMPVAHGPEQFAKVGPRNAMVIAVCSFALAIDRNRRRVGTGIGSAGPTPLRAVEAEAFLEGALEELDAWESTRSLDEATRARFGELVSSAARPIDDVRATAVYRRHALGVLAARTLAWALSDERGSTSD